MGRSVCVSRTQQCSRADAFARHFMEYAFFARLHARGRVGPARLLAWLYLRVRDLPPAHAAALAGEAGAACGDIEAEAEGGAALILTIAGSDPNLGRARLMRRVVNASTRFPRSSEYPCCRKFGLHSPSDRPMTVQRGGARPPGTVTLDQLLSKAEFEGIPTTTLRAHLEPARAGMWLPEGQTARRTLYDAEKVAQLATNLPRRRAVAPLATRRLRRRKMPSERAAGRPQRGGADGWVSVAQLAAELGREPRQVMRTLERHDAELRKIDRATSELRTLRRLLEQVHANPALAGPVPREKRVVDGRERWMFERAAALAAFDGGRPTQAMWMRWTKAKLATLDANLDEQTRSRIAETVVAEIVGWAFLEHEGLEARRVTERLTRGTREFRQLR